MDMNVAHTGENGLGVMEDTENQADCIPLKTPDALVRGATWDSGQRLVQVSPQFTPMSMIECDMPKEDIFDIVAVVLFVTDCKTIATGDGGLAEVREVYLMDESCENPILLTIWNSFMKVHGEVFEMWSHTWDVLAVTALQIHAYNGLAITHTSKSTLIQFPKDERALEMWDWVAANTGFLAHKRHNLLAVQAASKGPTLGLMRRARRRLTYDTDAGLEVSSIRSAYIDRPVSNGVHVLPKYQSIAAIPRESADNDLFGFMVYMGEPRTVHFSLGGQTSVRNVYLSDYSCDRPLLVVLSERILTEHPVLKSYINGFPLVAITSLLNRFYKGHTMMDTADTTLILDPEAFQSSNLKAWARCHGLHELRDHYYTLYRIHNPDSKPALFPISFINKKKATNTWHEMFFHIEGTMPKADIGDLHIHLGCTTCSRRCDLPLNAVFSCSACKAPDVRCKPSVHLQATVVDQSDCIDLVFFSDHVERLLGLSCDELWIMREKDNMDMIIEKIRLLHNKKIVIKLGPTIALAL